MDFRTELTPKHSRKINLKDPILTLGSCFSQSIGKKFTDFKFQTSINPFGTTYHPYAIHKLLSLAAKQKSPDQDTFLVNNDTHYNYDFHSAIHGTSLPSLKENIHSIITSAHQYLKSCSVIILTYGTAWSYKRTDNGNPVANCHKMPSHLFNKELIDSNDICISFKETYEILKNINPSLRIILTVSPVRHVNDTLELNSVSKSILRVACHRLSTENRDVEYFPAFEIMMDDLRDYRFYKSDLIHPTETAENYIWEKFIESYFDEPTKNFLDQWSQIQKAIHHRPFLPAGSAHQKFLHQTLSKLEELKLFTNVDVEISHLKSQITS
ncbi:MAG: GSCFA domain-containing protein [Cyclobacteriaceae bacterium]|nr:GSCFA domain-containing protein [Cyclobacteriaceae bacterium]